MKAERIVLSIIAILVGLFVAGIAFYFYQMTSAKPKEKNHVISILPSPSPEAEEALFTLTSPANESVSEEKTVTLKGTAVVGTTLVISTESGQGVITADQNGTFSDELTLDSGANFVTITAIRPDGKEQTQTFTLTYSTENY